MRSIIYNEEIHIYYAMEILNNYLDKHYITQDKKINNIVSHHTPFRCGHKFTN